MQLNKKLNNKILITSIRSNRLPSMPIGHQSEIKLSTIITVTIIFLILCILFSSSNGNAGPTHLTNSSTNSPIKSINQAIDGYLSSFASSLIKSPKERTTYSYKPIDKKIKLQQCDHTPDINITNQNPTSYERVALKVSCNMPKRWQIYVKASIQRFSQVVVPKQPIPRGTTLTQNHLSLKEMNLNLLFRGYYSNINQLVGSKTRYPLKVSNPINPAQVIAAQTIQKGERVTILATTKRFSISTSGIALMGGQVGDQIKVKNSRSQLIVHGWIQSKGLVTVNR